MFTPDRAQSIDVWVADVSPKTRWIFVEVTTHSGLHGYGEATLGGREDAVVAAIAKLAPAILASANASPASLASITALSGLVDAAAYSSMDQALWDLEAQRRGVPVFEALGAPLRNRVPVYANINRRTVDRSPHGFAASARDALVAGYRAIKIAPFDEVRIDGRDSLPDVVAVARGMERIDAVRVAIGSTCRLMVDCHWRLNERTAAAVIEAAAEYRPYWIECPLPETLDNLSALRRLRSLANRHGIRLAGCEENIRQEGFAPFLEAGVYDAMMPDVKYVGGLREILSLSNVLARSGVEFSPHNPSGPICHAASLHVCASAHNLSMLEVQFDESSWFNSLQASPLAPIIDGTAALPAKPGLGTGLDRSALEECSTLHWSAP